MKLAEPYLTTPATKTGGKIKIKAPTAKQVATAQVIMTLSAQPNPVDAVTFFCPALGRSFTWLQGLN